MRASWLLLSLPLLAACRGPGEPLGTAQEAITICPSGATLQGVDASTYDGDVDWTMVQSSGRAFAFAKATEGTTFTDDTFATNWAGMKQAGVIRSAYHFFHANVDPKAQASYFLGVMGTLEDGDLPPALDLEVNDNEPAATVTANAVTWLDTVAAATGTKPIVYTSTRVINDYLGGDPAGLEDHAQLWVSNWQVTCPDVPTPFTGWTFWQTGATGTVPGFAAAGTVDTDEFNGDLTALQALTVGGSSSSSSGSADGGDATCTVNGVAGTCLDTAICGLMTGYQSTAGYCPGPANVECCTPTGGSGSSSTSSSTSGATSSSSTSSSGSSSSGGTGGAGAGGGAGTGGAGGSGQGGKGVNTSGGCAAAPGGEGGGMGARAMLVGLALMVARRRRR